MEVKKELKVIWWIQFAIDFASSSSLIFALPFLKSLLNQTPRVEFHTPNPDKLILINLPQRPYHNHSPICPAQSSLPFPHLHWQLDPRPSSQPQVPHLVNKARFLALSTTQNFVLIRSSPNALPFPIPTPFKTWLASSHKTLSVFIHNSVPSVPTLQRLAAQRRGWWIC